MLDICNSNRHGYLITNAKQECIPIGCVPPAAVAIFRKWNRTFSEFGESDKSLKHELGSV